MKDVELKKFIEGKDLTKEEDFSNLLNSINEAINAKDADNKREYSKLQEEYKSLKTEKESSDKTSKDYLEKLANAEKENKILKNHAWIYKNINPKMDDQDINDYNAIIESRLTTNPKAKWEDVAKEVAKTRGFISILEEKKEEVVTPKKEEPIGVRYKGSNDYIVPEYDDNSEQSQRDRFNSLISKKHK